MKAIYPFIFLLIFVMQFPVLAQVGINTENPQGKFHIDPLQNNPVSGTISGSAVNDDIIITEQGRLGIHTLTPQQKVEINSTIANVSGLRLSGITSETPKEKVAANVLGIDENGDVVVAAKLPANHECTPGFLLASSTSSTNLNVTENGIPSLTVLLSEKIWSDGTVQLKKGNTYRLEAVFRNGKTATGTPRNAYFSYEFYNISSGNALPNQTRPKAIVLQNDQSGSTGSQPLLITFITPEADINVGLRFTNVTGSGNTYTPSQSYISITQLNPCFL